jgi:DNA-binding XRE family transcriptional regulator
MWMNDQTGRLGPFFADRPRDYALREIGAASTIGYIHNNPVRAGLVGRARDSEWTSHRAYVGLAPTPSWLHIEDGMFWAQATDSEDFERYVDGAPRPPERPAGGRVSRAARRRGQINDATPMDNGVPLVIRHFARVRPDPRAVVAHVGRFLGIDDRLLASRRRAMLGLTGSDIAAVLGISPQAVSQILRHTVRPATICEEVCRLVESNSRA